MWALALPELVVIQFDVDSGEWTGERREDEDGGWDWQDFFRAFNMVRPCGG